ncbi:putative sodium-dependent multivitamin transporter [Panulirus ornatus]|uniref:putative sodium-dependent multivitamin transporter n=1 Tax=Panulirus ornatus TaxID=150431 RepID=UPI003A84369B
MSALKEPATDKGDLVWSDITALDFTVFGLFLVAYIAIGIYSGIKGRDNASTQEYLLGGKKMSVLPVAFSMVGGVLSAIAILGYSTEIYFFGTQLCIHLLGIIPGSLFAYQVILPIFHRFKLVSTMEYIELRYKSAALRKLMTLGQIVASFMYMGMCQYAPSLALFTLAKIPNSVSILVTGIVSTFYTTIARLENHTTLLEP